jgi:hypothetical protein
MMKSSRCGLPERQTVKNKVYRKHRNHGKIATPCRPHLHPDKGPITNKNTFVHRSNFLFVIGPINDAVSATDVPRSDACHGPILFWFCCDPHSLGSLCTRGCVAFCFQKEAEDVHVHCGGETKDRGDDAEIAEDDADAGKNKTIERTTLPAWVPLECDNIRHDRVCPCSICRTAVDNR